jgi:SSS family solute:Na+ symporter
METGTLIALGLYFALMLGIGIWSWRRSTSDVSGYMLGGRQLGPAVSALSAGASDMSGWILMGLPGAMYLTGLSSGWIAVGPPDRGLGQLPDRGPASAGLYSGGQRLDHPAGLL